MKYSDLQVWQKSMDLVVDIYKLSEEFPSGERFGLALQLQKAAVSVPSNIAEGHGRKATGAFVNHLSIACGSLMEAETQVQIAERLGYVRKAAIKPILEKAGEIGRMLNGLQRSLSIKGAAKSRPESRIPNPES